MTNFRVLKRPSSVHQSEFCVALDYRQLNAITIKNRYALPLISELHGRFRQQLR